MRLAFLGAPVFALPSLAALLAAGHEIARVYSQPAAPAGRGQVARPTPVAALAIERDLPLSTPPSLRDAAAVAELASLKLDAAVVVAFGQILPEPLLSAPRLGSYNLHASLLPRWRGAAPIQRAIMAGDALTGVQVMRMTAGLDEGPILASRSTRIDALDTAGSLHDRLAQLGAALLVETLAALAAGVAREAPQADEGATYARKIRPNEARLRWNAPAAAVDARIRGLSPHPGAWFAAPSERGPTRVKALLSRIETAGPSNLAPGEVAETEGLVIGCDPGAVRLLRAQREGRAAQDIGDFLRGFAIAPGARL